MNEFLRRLPGAMVFFLRGLVTSIAGNLSLAVISAVLALSLWLFVSERENPREVQAFNSAIPIEFVNVPGGLAVANTSAPSVRIRIEAPEDELDDLEAADFEANVNLGGFEAGTVSVAVEVTPPNSRINVVDVEPSIVDVRLEPLRQKDVPVQVSQVGSLQQGFAVAEARAEPEEVTVSGPESLVALVDSVGADVNVSGLRVDTTFESVELQPQDERGGLISRVTVSPRTADVFLDIEQREFTSTFSVSPTIAGQPAAGYNVRSVRVEPAFVEVRGTLEVLESLGGISGIATEEVAITDARTDVSRDVALTLPEGASVVEGDATVRVTIDIEPARGEASFQVVPQVRNVAGDLAVVGLQAVTVTLSGDVPTLQSITPEGITVVADATGLGAGLHALPLQVTAPQGTSVVRVEPAEASFALAPRQ
ncbi:MAG TPA: CdaR family protein [Dehalococcoidia bacterium]|nr:CdaR family protein [Dehalococcoidia bacterium]